MSPLEKFEVFAWGLVCGVGLAQSFGQLMRAIDDANDRRKNQ